MIGFKELALLAVVVLVLYGRSGVLKNRQVQASRLTPGSRPNRARRTAPSICQGVELDAAAIRRSLRTTWTVGKSRGRLSCGATGFSGS